MQFLTETQLIADCDRLIAKLPANTDAVLGVARSGMLPASIVAMRLHLPLFCVRQTHSDLVYAGGGWRIGGSHMQISNPIVIDDTCMTGRSVGQTGAIARKTFPQAKTAAVYCCPTARRKPDFYAAELQEPHLLAWNLPNSVYSQSMAIDFDGILCRDCRPEEDDDGPRYKDFLRNAEPRYLFRKFRIPLIVTARAEGYRRETLQWLKRHKITFDRLEMYPAKTSRERNRSFSHSYKANHYRRWYESHQSPTGFKAFFESCPQQSQQIHQLTELPVICPSGQVFDTAGRLG